MSNAEMEAAQRMSHADVEAAYEAVMRANGAEPYVHAHYEAADQLLVRMATEYYGEVLVEYAREWIGDCGEVPSLVELRDRWMRDKISDLDEAALRAAHATDVMYGGVDAEPVVKEFKLMVELMDEMQTVVPEQRRAETLGLAMIHAMKAKALDYGVELQ